MDYENRTNLPTEADITPEISSAQIAHEILFFIFCLLGMACDSLIIYTVFKFQRLRTVSNVLLANWAIADIFSILVTPCGFRIFSVLENIAISRDFFCVILNTGMEFHTNTMIFIILVCLNWALESCVKKDNAAVKKYYQIGIGFVWFITLVLISLSIKECLTPYESSSLRSDVFLSYTLFLYMGIVVILQIARAIAKCCKKLTENSYLMLNLATVYLACWLLGMMSSSSNQALQLIAECLMFSSSQINLTLLYFFNQDFQAHLLQVVKCSSNKYQEASASFENPIVRVQNGTSGVEVCIGNPS